MKAVVFDADTGRIIRGMEGKVPLERQRVGANHGMVVNTVTASPEGIEPFYGPVSIPDDLDGKMVDTADGTIVDDPNHSVPRSDAEIATDLRDGTVTTKEALLEVLEHE